MGARCSSRKSESNKANEHKKPPGLPASRFIAMKWNTMEMLTTERLVNMKWNIVVIGDWYAEWRIACQARMRVARMTTQEYLSDDILWSSVHYRQFEIANWIYVHLCRYDYPKSKMMDIISHCASITNTNTSNALDYVESQKLLQFFLVNGRPEQNTKLEIVPILFKHHQFQLLIDNLGKINFNILYPFLCANNLLSIIKFFALHNQNQFKNPQMWRKCIHNAWQNLIDKEDNKPATMETIAYVLGQVGYERVNAEKTHPVAVLDSNRRILDLDKKVTEPIILSWLICFSPLQTITTTIYDGVQWSKSYVKKIEKHLDEYNHLFLAVDFDYNGGLSSSSSSSVSIPNTVITKEGIDKIIRNRHLFQRIMELYATSPKIRKGLGKQFGWDNYLPIVEDQLQRMKSTLASHISDPAVICFDYLFSL